MIWEDNVDRKIDPYDMRLYSFVFIIRPFTLVKIHKSRVFSSKVDPTLVKYCLTIKGLSTPFLTPYSVFTSSKFTVVRIFVPVFPCFSH